MERKAIVIGAMGLVGEYIVRELLTQELYSEVLLLVRRPLELQHRKLKQEVVHWDRLEESAHLFYGVHDLFSALGTTRKQAGSQARFRKVDLEYPVAAAKLAAGAGVKQMLDASSMGANPASRLFYSRTKGEAEEQLAAVGLTSLRLVRIIRKKYKH